MKKLFLLALWLLPGLCLAQTAPAAATLNFCGVSIPVPAGCTPETSYSVRCERYQLNWFYLNHGQLLPVVETMVKTEMKKHKPAEDQPFEAFILDTPAKGHRLSYTIEGGEAYQLIFYGTAKGQPVVVQLTMDVDPEKTADLPEIAQRMVRLSK
jgi:hypothetical protein